MQNFLFFLGRYEVVQGPVLHTSPSCTVMLASDHSYNGKDGGADGFRVALKFMKHRAEFERELSSRVGTSDKYVVPVVASYADEPFATTATEGTVFPECVSVSSRYRSDCKRIGLEPYPYLLVLPACTFSLADMILHGHIAPTDRESIRGIMRDLALAVGEMHKLGRIHGDVKPLNILRRYRVLV